MQSLQSRGFLSLSQSQAYISNDMTFRSLPGTHFTSAAFAKTIRYLGPCAIQDLLLHRNGDLERCKRCHSLSTRPLQSG